MNKPHVLHYIISLLFIASVYGIGNAQYGIDDTNDTYAIDQKTLLIPQNIIDQDTKIFKN